MNKARRRLFIEIGISVILLYFVLVFGLMLVESTDPSSKIQTMGDAFWYSLVTLTTVGYGDMVPVTPGGHVIATIFLILSIGILATLIGTLVSFLASQGIPRLSLDMEKDENWYYFADLSQESDALARQIQASDPHAIIIFGESRENANLEPDYPCQFLDISPSRLAKMKGKNGSRCKIFLMKENDIGVNPRAEDISDLPVDVYARTTSGEDSLSGNIHFFNSYECCAREYWRSRPMSPDEHEIAILGFGHYGQALLERAIMTNVYDPDQHITYHIFGDARKFLNIHCHLDTVFSLQTESPERDSLIFHEDSWDQARELLQKMDRIIICEDDEFTGWDIMWQLRKFYIVPGRIDLRSSRKAKGLSCFGDNDAVYSPEHILKTSLNRAAVALNDEYRKRHPGKGLDWDHLNDYRQQSLIAAADHMYTKVRILLNDPDIQELTSEILKQAAAVYADNIQDPSKLDWYRRLEHLRWLRFYCYYNWTWGETHKEETRQDPRVTDYKKMPPELQANSDYYWGLLGQIALQNDRTLSDRS